MTIPFHKVLEPVPHERLELVDEHLVRFHYRRPREVPEHWRMLLEHDFRTDAIELSAPDRKAVSERFRHLHRLVGGEYAKYMRSDYFERAGVRTPDAWLRVVIDHHCMPYVLYTNAQELCTVVTRGHSWWEVAVHPGVEALVAFREALRHGEVEALIDADRMRIFATAEAAETYAQRVLANMRIRFAPLRKGAGRKSLALLPAGTRPGPRGVPIELAVARVDGTERLLQLEPGRWDAYTALNRLGDELEGWVLEGCATCRSFRFSGTLREASEGHRGLCRRRVAEARASELPSDGKHEVKPRMLTEVGVLDRCAQWEPIADEDRELPFCLSAPAD